MTAASRYLLNSSLRHKRHSVFSRYGFSKTLLIDDKKIQKVEGKNATKESAKREIDRNVRKNVQKGSDKTDVKVCIIGGGVTPLYTAVLLKRYRIIESIRLVDTKDSTPGALADAYHMETIPRINIFRRKHIKQALKEANIVALMDETDTAGDIAPRAQFKSALDYTRRMTDRILVFCPDALVAVFARPVTATLAMVSEMFRCSGCRNPNRIVGSTATYGARIEETAAALLDLERASLAVPLAGGADARTIVPLLSRAVPFNQFTNGQRKILLRSFRANDKEATTGGQQSIDVGGSTSTSSSSSSSSSLSYGTAAAKLIVALAAGLSGFDRVTTCAYVRSNVLPVCRFFTSQLQLGPEGVEKNLGLPKISPVEILMIERAIPLINEYVDMAIAAVRAERIRTRMR